MKLSTANPDEIAQFSRIADKWWDPNGEFRPLHNLNPARLTYIKDQLSNYFDLDPQAIRPLEGLTLIDIGCGGGLLTEPMCRLGAEVTAIDASEKNINVAKLHSKKNDLKINYICTSPEKLQIKNKFDVILNMEIVEHVEDVNFFLKSSSKLLKKNGIMFIATLNKTLKSYIFAIVGAEYILRWLPIGTHEWEKFVKPEELISILKKNDLNIDRLDGMKFNMLTDSWTVSDDKSINYIAKFIKN